MGYWSNHKYKRRSVKKDSELGFLGWLWLEEILSKFTGRKKDRNRALVLITFKTAGRINEVLQLRRSNFTQNKKYIIVKDMLLEKNKDQKIRRAFKFPKTEPLNEILVEWVNAHNKYIFPSPSHLARKIDTPLSYIRAYQIFTKVGTYPHFLRSQRASQLVKEYKWGDGELKEWMNWESFEMTGVYTGQEIQSNAEAKMLVTRNS